MKNYRTLLLLAALTIALGNVWAQGPNETGTYYKNANGQNGQNLRKALAKIISQNHSVVSYDGLISAYEKTDTREDGKVRDWYSCITNYVHGKDTGGYRKEGDSYNREHSVPQSWFNKRSPMKSDIVHVVPTDGYVNNRRSNYPFGEVGSASWTSQNGSKLGSCKTPGYSGTVFEPIDAYKGDFARAIMYMSVRYYGEDSGWGSSDMTSKSVIKPWAIALLLRWNKQDPVSQKEIDRNNAIYNDYQHNRNPFVDHPEYADMIWDPSWTLEENQEQAHADGMVVYDLTGRKLFQSNINNEEEAITSMKSKLKQGCYILLLLDGNRVVTRRKLLVN